MKTRNLLLGLCLILWPIAGHAQVYRNVVNTRFGTVASGPMQALVVDVANPGSAASVRAAVVEAVRAARAAREGAVLRQVQALRSAYHLKGEATAGIPDIVVLRSGGKLVTRSVPRTRALNELTFTIPRAPDTGTPNPGDWPALRQADLVNIVQLVYPALKTLYGAPSWSGTVKVMDADSVSPIMSDRNALSGGVYNVSTGEIWLPENLTPQTTVLNVTQMMAIAFHGPASMSYDVWERGMARAASIRLSASILPALQTIRAQSFSGFTYLGDEFDTADPHWQAMDTYDLLNQRPLANDRFFPVGKASTPFDQYSIGGMLVPRLRMASSVWLKVIAEDPGFFPTFNALYYQAVATNPGLANDVPGLKALAKQALANDNVATVEGLDFLDWYQRQYVLDTSVSPGVKEYALIMWGSRPEGTADVYGVAVTLLYYQTTLDSSGNSDEIPLSATCYPVYWNYLPQRLSTLGAQYERLEIGRPPSEAPGEGSFIPTFPATLGGADPNCLMRVMMDLPVNAESVRVYVAPRNMGPAATPNNFWGVVVGSDTGTMRIVTETGVDVTTNVSEGAFGVALPADAFSRPNRATLTFTDSGGLQTVRHVSVGMNEFVPIFYAADPITSRTHQFPAGPTMISFPIQPLQSKAAQALLDPGTGLPLFNDGNLLLAQWRQNLSGSDRYLRYPSLGPLTPGMGYWAGFPSATTVKIVGRVASADQDASNGLLAGWNQIGNPYETAVDTSTLLFQWGANADTVATLQQAITNGWVAAQTLPDNSQVAIWSYDPSTGYGGASTLQPWQGYFIRVLVSEGLTITYPNPSGRSRAANLTLPRPARPSAPGGWALPLTVRGPDGRGATAYIGQSEQASTGYDPRMDALRPPDFSRAVPSIAVPHLDWGANAGYYYSDIHRTTRRDSWDIVVSAPVPGATYTLTWGNLAGLPNGARLTLIDTTTHRFQNLQPSRGYTFVPGSSTTRRFHLEADLRGR